MERGGGRFLRDNAFLAAAVALPGAVVLLFVLASAIPRWTVAAPAYDVLLKAAGPYDQALPRIAVDFAVRDGAIEATVRALPDNAYPQLASLFLFDHRSLAAREIPFELPKDLKAGDPPRTIPIVLPGAGRVLPGTKTPDGYQLDTRSQRGGGLVGDIFGMNRYNEETMLVNRGRLIQIGLPETFRYQSPISVVGWIADETGR